MSNITNQYTNYIPLAFVAVVVICLFNRICQCCCQGKPRTKEVLNRNDIIDVTIKDGTRYIDYDQDKLAAENLLTIKSNADVINLIFDIDAKQATALSTAAMLFPSITGSQGSCAASNVQNLLNRCNNLQLLKVLIIEDSKRSLTIKDCHHFRFYP